jgi:hypothetical protein
MDHSFERPSRVWEHSEEGVALRPYLSAASPDDRLAQYLGMPVDDLPVAIAELSEKQSGTLDVGEQERDGSGGQVRHLDSSVES